jgi:hypothetical protein
MTGTTSCNYNQAEVRVCSRQPLNNQFEVLMKFMIKTGSFGPIRDPPIVLHHSRHKGRYLESTLVALTTVPTQDRDHLQILPVR